MRRLIAAMNMTLDGFCDHTSMSADEETHQHYTDLLKSVDTLLYGRTTYQLMEDYWPALVTQPSGDPSMDDFAIAIDNVSKIVFSHTLKQVNWKTARVAKGTIEEEVSALKQQPGGDILAGSPSIIVAATNLGLVDEFQIGIHPNIVGKGLTLFKNIHDRIDLQLVKTKTFGCGAVFFYYKPANK